MPCVPSSDIENSTAVDVSRTYLYRMWGAVWAFAFHHEIVIFFFLQFLHKSLFKVAYIEQTVMMLSFHLWRVESCRFLGVCHRRSSQTSKGLVKATEKFTDMVLCLFLLSALILAISLFFSFFDHLFPHLSCCLSVHCLWIFRFIVLTSSVFWVKAVKHLSHKVRKGCFQRCSTTTDGHLFKFLPSWILMDDTVRGSSDSNVCKIMHLRNVMEF